MPSPDRRNRLWPNRLAESGPVRILRNAWETISAAFKPSRQEQAAMILVLALFTTGLIVMLIRRAL